jgi:hypothetical protein
MEVFATFVLILLAGMALPIVLLISGVLFNLVVAIYVVITTLGSRKRKPRTFGAVRRSGRARESRGTVVVWEY